MSTNQKETGKEQRTVLYVDDEPDKRLLFEATFASIARRRGLDNYRILTAADFAQAEQSMYKGIVAVVTDGQVETREGIDGVNFLRSIQQSRPGVHLWLHSNALDTGHYKGFRSVRKTDGASAVITEVFDALQV